MEQRVLDVLTHIFEDHIEDALEAGHEAYAEGIEKYGNHAYGVQMAQAAGDRAILDHLSEQVKHPLDFGG